MLYAFIKIHWLRTTRSSLFITLHESHADPDLGSALGTPRSYTSQDDERTDNSEDCQAEETEPGDLGPVKGEEAANYWQGLEQLLLPQPEALSPPPPSRAQKAALIHDGPHHGTTPPVTACTS